MVVVWEKTSKLRPGVVADSASPSHRELLPSTPYLSSASITSLHWFLRRLRISLNYWCLAPLNFSWGYLSQHIGSLPCWAAQYRYISLSFGIPKKERKKRKWVLIVKSVSNSFPELTLLTLLFVDESLRNCRH
ncbi:hypothetical protein Cob_v007023 [Colletotrichum orbiculare MAFF 240422]|uniref:Uncharacterized protein n=1 Tax=Colletotrichum orbiculare (strain 104-T / ATCC 96160 / CBS 514.97 / LARS 414 / MAFF 240422) TaxID=1213857 RepID=A0A484FS13_COLOR|nr:hypothetical protein Cob_v007023 [Colletotrichum orbiculare MAFF 240422]